MIRNFIIFIFMGISILLFSACDAWDYGEHPQLKAVKKIAEYADSNDTKNAPDAKLYKAAGVEIDASDINATNRYIKTLSYSDVDTTEEIQAVVDNIDAYTNIAPVAKIHVESTSVKEGEMLYLDGIGSSDSDGAIVSYEWKIGTKVVHQGISYDAKLNKGRYIIELVVKDDYNATGSDMVSVIVRDVDDNDTTPVPITVLKAVIKVTENNDTNNSSVTLDGSTSTYNQRSTKFEWKENNKVVKTGKTYTVKKIGKHTITLLLTDGDKTDSATKTITVK